MTTHLDDLIAELQGEPQHHPDVQFRAAIALGKVTDPRSCTIATAALIDALCDTNPALVRTHAAQGLGELRASEAFEALVGALQDAYRLTRSYAARALGKLGDPRAIPPLIQTLQHDPFFGARAEAAEALRKICPDDAKAPCREARKALKAHRKRELERNEERSRRVLAEMDLSLDQIESVLGDILAALHGGHVTEVEDLARDGIRAVHAARDDSDRMGGLLHSRTRLIA